MSSNLSVIHSKVPRHIAIIMDGNRRWAKQHNKKVISGHKAGVKAIRTIVEAISQYDTVKTLTLFAFSSENWQRPESEVKELMQLFLRYLEREVEVFHRHQLSVRFIGERSRFDAKLIERMQYVEKETAVYQAKTLVIAADYGGLWDITHAAKNLACDVQQGKVMLETVDESLFDKYLSLSDLSSPDLCIRTGGECRISNFLLWQMAYTELYFSDVYWPDFGKNELLKALVCYQERQRRFGGDNEFIS